MADGTGSIEYVHRVGSMAPVPEQPKKPAGGGFGQFLAEKRTEFAKQCPGAASAVTKLAGERWRDLPEAEKEPYNNAFKEAQKKYAADMESFLAEGGVKQKGAAALRSERKKAREGTAKKQKDPNAPKRPVGGGYGCFLNARREEFQKACSGVFIEVTKMAAEKWKALPEGEKESYAKEYADKLAKYQEAMKSYTPPPGDDDDEESEPPAKRANVAN